MVRRVRGDAAQRFCLCLLPELLRFDHRIPIRIALCDDRAFKYLSTFRLPQWNAQRSFVGLTFTSCISLCEVVQDPVQVNY